MCLKGLGLWEMLTHQAVDSKHPTQVTDVRVEGSVPARFHFVKWTDHGMF